MHFGPEVTASGGTGGADFEKAPGAGVAGTSDASTRCTLRQLSDLTGVRLKS